MSTCTVSNMEITESPNWRTSHKDNNDGYQKVVKRLGKDIILYSIEADHDISLDTMNIGMLQTVLQDSKIENKPVCLLWNMKHITNISLTYKKQIANLIYNRRIHFGIVVFFNVEPECLTLVESFAAMVPEDMTVLIKQHYTEAVNATLAWKEGLPVGTIYESAEEEKYELQKNEFLSALARISWLDMMEQSIPMPSNDDKLLPFFQAISHLQSDLLEISRDKEQELRQIEQDGEKTLTEKNILLNAQKELYKKLKNQLEKEKSALTARIATQEMELTRISTAVVEKTSALRQLLDLIATLDIDQGQKRTMIDICSNMIDTELIEKRLNIELTTTDSEFLSKLQKKHPNLNQRELRICLLIKLNYNTRDIARSVGISTRGMESIRYRMHKKVGLSKHQSLKSYLTELIMQRD